MTTEYLEDRLVAEAIARRAGKNAFEERKRGFNVGYKSKNDIVTSVDVANEEMVKGLLSAIFNDAFLGEELGAEGDSQGRRWVIDPIDGTLNFSMGVPMYCVSIALQVDGKSVAGAIYDPNRDELFSAHLGGGATLDGKPIHVSEHDNFEEAVLVTGFPPNKRKGFNNLENFTKLCFESRAVRRFGSAAIDLCYVAAGRIDGFWEFGLKPWDTAAGYLIATEAGATVTNYYGEPYLTSDKSLIASNGKFHNHFIERLTFEE